MGLREALLMKQWEPEVLPTLKAITSETCTKSKCYKKEEQKRVREKEKGKEKKISLK